MSSKKKRLEKSRLYAVTNLKSVNPAEIRIIEKALKGGVDIIQLRSKTLSMLELFQIGQKIRVLTHKTKKLFIVNDYVDLAIALQADGVHLGQDDLPISIARKMAGKNMLIGRSTHSLAQAEKAQKEKADYIGFGPLFETPTKPTYDAIGLNLIPKVLKRVSIPIVFIGGIDHSNVDQVTAKGARCAAVVRAIFSSHNPYKAAHTLKTQIISGIRSKKS